MTRRRLLLAGAAMAGLSALYAGSALWKALRAFRTATAEVAAAGSLNFTVRALDRALPAVETIGSPAVFTDAAIFQGSIYVTTPSQLIEYDSAGAVKRRWRSGLELPGAQLGQMTTGAVANSAGPELWVATNGAGLLEFDGRTFRQIAPADPGARKVTALISLETGWILFGTAGSGVLGYDGKRLAPLDPSFAGLHVTALAGGVTSMWVGTINHGVYHRHAGELEHFGEAEGLPDPQVTSILADAGGAYVGTPMGIAEFRDGRYVRSLAAGFFASALSRQGDILLAGSLEEGVVEIPITPRVPRLVRDGPVEPPGGVRRIFEWNGKPLAVTTEGLWAGPSWKRAIAPEAGRLTDRNISALAVDSRKRLWIGYFDRGLDVLDGARISHFENDSLFCINRIAANPDASTMAVATANGLVMFDARLRQQQVLRKAQGLLADHVTDVTFAGGGMTLATPAGITFLDAAGTHSVSDFHGLVNPHVYALGSADGQLLAGTLGGLSVLEGGAVKASYTTFNSHLKHNWITAIQRVGDDWFVGTYGAGVMRLTRNGEWDAFPDLGGPMSINPNAMLVTANRVYAGSLERGLLVFERSSGRWTTVTDGLPSVNVTALAESGGALYIGTDNGLVRIMERSLQ
jgi:ligand-binding sensor domain-containing protein